MDEQWNTKEQAYAAGIKEGKRIAEENAREDREASGGEGDGLTLADLRKMSEEELTRRKPEVDAALTKLGEEGA